MLVNEGVSEVKVAPEIEIVYKHDAQPIQPENMEPQGQIKYIRDEPVNAEVKSLNKKKSANHNKYVYTFREFILYSTKKSLY